MSGGNPGGQLLRLLALLREGEQSTLSLINAGISTPARRVLDLRRLGYTVQTVIESELNGEGKRVTFAHYHLVSEPDNTPSRMVPRANDEETDPPLHLVRVPKMRRRDPVKRVVNFIEHQRG